MNAEKRPRRQDTPRENRRPPIRLIGTRVSECYTDRAPYDTMAVSARSIAGHTLEKECPYGKTRRGGGSIYRRKDGRWTVEISLEGGKSKFLYGKSRREVQEKLKTALYEQQRGMLVTGPQQKVGRFLTHWLEDVHRQSIRPRTCERYEEIVRLHLEPGFGHHRLQKLSLQHLQSFYKKKLEEGLSTTTVISFHNVLHKALETAARWNLIARNPCDLSRPQEKALRNPAALDAAVPAVPGGRAWAPAGGAVHPRAGERGAAGPTSRTAMQKEPLWRLYRGGSIVLGTDIQVLAFPGQQERLVEKLKAVYKAQRHTFPGTMVQTHTEMGKGNPAQL